MSSKQLIRFGLVVAAALVVWGGITLGRHFRGDNRETFALPRVDTASVDSFVFTTPNTTSVLARAGGAWTINGMPTSRSAVTQFLQGFAEGLKSNELVADDVTSYTRLGVNADSGQRVRAFSHGKALFDLITGGAPGDAGGEMFVRRKDSDDTYALRGPLSLALRRTPDDWRDKHIASIEPDSVGSIDIGRATGQYVMKRAASGWTFASGAAVDTNALQTMLGFYRDLNGTAIATKAQTDSAHFTTSPRHIRVTSKNGKLLLSLSIDSIASGIWARADSAGPVYKIEAFMMAQIAPAENTLTAKKNP